MRYWNDKDGGKPKKPKPGAPADDEDTGRNKDTEKEKYPTWDEVVKKLNARYKGA
jgi:hypothetical protein